MTMKIIFVYIFMGNSTCINFFVTILPVVKLLYDDYSVVWSKGTT